MESQNEPVACLTIKLLTYTIFHNTAAAATATAAAAAAATAAAAAAAAAAATATATAAATAAAAAAAAAVAIAIAVAVKQSLSLRLTVLLPMSLKLPRVSMRSSPYESLTTSRRHLLVNRCIIFQISQPLSGADHYI